MKFMVVVKANQDSEAGVMPSQQLLTEMGNYNEALAKAGVLLAGDGLHPSSKGARVRFSGSDRTVIDGPFAETKELIAGYWLWRVNSLQEAIEWLKRCPNPHAEDCEVEIRQIFDADDFGAEFTPELRKQEAGVRAQAMGLGAVQFEQGREMLIAGYNGSYGFENRDKIPMQWERFVSHIGKVPGQIGKTSYGVCWKLSGNSFEYLSGVEVDEGATLPADFKTVKIPAGEYVIFTHPEHVSVISTTIDKIWNGWVPESGLKIANAPCFERYTENFSPHTGMDGMEIWLPIET